LDEDEPNMEKPCLTIVSAGDNLINVLKGPYSHITDELDYLMEAGDYYYDNGEAYRCSFVVAGILIVFGMTDRKSFYGIKYSIKAVQLQ
jgi:hypothetical protein